jgi:hypothetical protein
MRDARVRGIVYQNLGRLGLVTEAQSTSHQIQTNGAFAEMDPRPETRSTTTKV